MLQSIHSETNGAFIVHCFAALATSTPATFKINNRKETANALGMTMTNNSHCHQLACISCSTLLSAIYTSPCLAKR
ncbi:hypothetical protein BRO54_3097 [Geobacillus proteiniphilus]|uniref:Uncharacterized protein n=1 Tax=Geobacillus proteiniphilus TaxID=860353 RepID=A0A1Q5SQL3_9BACL|nr:hypothetical protein BRO54_3097 [Geobacillus proteiniphilus]